VGRFSPGVNAGIWLNAGGMVRKIPGKKSDWRTQKGN